MLNRSPFPLQDQWIYKSTDGGASWTQMTDIATGQTRPLNLVATSFFRCDRPALNGDIRYLSSPQIAILKDRKAPAGYVIHAVYPYDSDGAGPDNSNVFYTQSTDGALTWSAEVQLNDDATTTDQFLPALAVGILRDDDDKFPVVGVSFYDRRLDPTFNLSFDRFAVISPDGGSTWLPNQRISDVTSPVAAPLIPNFDSLLVRCYHGDYDQVAFRRDTFHFIWSDDRRITASGPNPDIFYQNVRLDPDDLDDLDEIAELDDDDSDSD